MRTARLRIVASVVAGVIAAGASLLVARLVGVAVVTGAAVAVIVVLTARHPDTLVAADVPTFAVGRWSGLAVAFVAVAAVVTAVTLPLDPRARLAVGLLLACVGYAAWLFGIAYARGKAD